MENNMQNQKPPLSPIQTKSYNEISNNINFNPTFPSPSLGNSNINNNMLRDVMFTAHPLNLVLSQPELGFFPIQPKK